MKKGSKDQGEGFEATGAILPWFCGSRGVCGFNEKGVDIPLE